MPKILEKIPVLIFAGDQDLICNYVGLEASMQAMTWNGHTGFGVRLAYPLRVFCQYLTIQQTVQTQSWSVNNTPAGTWVSNRNLTYAKVGSCKRYNPMAS